MRNSYKRTTLLLGMGGVLGAGLLAACGSSQAQAPAAKASTTAMHVGFVPSATIQSNIGEALIHTNIMALNHLSAKFISFTAGGTENQAMLSGQLDAEIVGGEPAAALAAQNYPFEIVGVTNHAHAGFFVKAGSPYHSLKDLKGQTVAADFGSDSYLYLVNLLKQAGLVPGKTVKVINLAPADQYLALQHGDIAGYMTFDTYIANAEAQGGVQKLVEIKTDPVVVIMSKAFITAHPNATVDFLKALNEGTWYMATHPSQVNQWVAAGGNMQLKAVAKASSLNANYSSVKNLSDVHPSASSADLTRLHQDALFLVQGKKNAKPVNLTPYVNTSWLNKALTSLQKSPPNLSAIKVQPGS